MHDEYKGVVVLNGLDGGFSAQRVLDHSVLVEGSSWLHGPQSDFGRSRLDGGLGSSESGVGPDLGFLSSVRSFLDSS